MLFRSNGGEELRKMREAQRRYAPGDAAADTAALLNELIKPYWREA